MVLSAADSMTDRAHSEMPSPFAALSIALNSDGVTRARTISDFASPFGSLGRPNLFLLCATKKSLQK